MKFKYDGLEQIFSEIRIFKKRKFNRTQDYEMKWRSSSPMKNDQPRSDHINQTFHFDNLAEEVIK